MSILDDLKTVGKTLQEIGRLEQYDQILEARKQLLEMQEEINELRASNADLRDKLKKKGKLVKDSFVYFLIENDKKEGPFCTRCWEKDQNLITLQKNKVGHWNFMCPECNNKVTYRE